MAADRTAPPRVGALARPSRTDIALIAVGVAGVSTSAPLIRAAAAPSFSVATWRMVLACAVVVPWALWRARDELRGLTRREWWLSAVAGALLAAHFATWIPSLSFTSIGSSVALVATQPVYAALIARYRGDEVPRSAWVGIGLAVLGAATLTGIDFSISAKALFGDLLAVLGGMLAAAYVTVGAAVRRTVTTTTYTAICYPVAALGLLASALVAGQPLSGYSAKVWWCIAGLTVGAQLLGHSVFNRVLKTTSPTVVSVAILFEIVGASVLAAISFGETPPLAAIPAAALIAAGVVLVVRAGDQPEVSGTPVVE